MGWHDVTGQFIVVSVQALAFGRSTVAGARGYFKLIDPQTAPPATTCDSTITPN
jgi:hypothetical protein